MDGGGRLDQPLKRSGQSATRWFGAPGDEPDCARIGADPEAAAFAVMPARRRLPRWIARLGDIPQGAGLAGSLLLLGATLTYGAVAGGHVGAVTDWFKGARDNAANALGFRIAAVALTGNGRLSREQTLTLAGVNGRASLLFFDAETARAGLLADPWIAEAAVLKLYPDRLLINVTERRPFALWQCNGKLSVIAADGTVLQPFVEDSYRGLPLVVGSGAERRAKDFIGLLDRYPEIRSALRASVLVAERRWNLRLLNGMDVRLPEGDLQPALDRLVKLDREKKLLSRDVSEIDLRLPDRVTVRLSDAAAQARDEALKASAKKKKGGDA
jgi:cell division protein FtsQ